MPTSRYHMDGTYRITNLSKKVYKISYGNYFEAILSTLEHDNFRILISILSQKFAKPVPLTSVEYISIFLEKHGAFYHPSKLEVCIGGYSLFFVVNVAISEEGKITIKQEVKALNLLTRTVPLNFIPRIYAHSVDNPIQLPMFFGEWFSDFHEFHLSLHQKTKTNKIVVWNYPHNDYLLSHEQTKQLYYQIAMIISLHYDPISTSQISSWHNASGDFVVSVGINCLQTRLISVRKFKPMLMDNDGHKDISLDIVLHALVVFLLHVSIHIRLDRLDGVGRMILGRDDYICSSLKGFLQGLHLAAMNRSYPYGFVNLFKDYLLNYSSNDLLDLAIDIVNKIYKERLEEKSIIVPKLDEHVGYLHTNLQKLNVSS